MLPRPSSNAENLQLLRQQALARVVQEEEQAPLVSRRWSLQRIGVILAGAAVLGTRAARAAGPRCPAPQYGAPGFYPSPPTPLLTTPMTRANLARLDHWVESRANLITPVANPGIYGMAVITHTANYTLPSGDTIGLLILDDLATNFTYILDAQQPFYVSDGSTVYGAHFGTAELVLSPAIFKYRTQPDGIATVLAAFASSVKDSTLAKAASPDWDIHIPLDKGPTQKDWKDSLPQINNMTIADGVLKIGGWGPGPHSGTYSIDLKSKKLLKYEGR